MESRLPRHLMTKIDYAALAEDRSRFFWWLAEWFLSPPNAERIASLPDPGTTPPEPDDMDLAWQALARSKPASAPVDILSIEYTRLFSGMQEGIGPPPPFESVWRESRLMGESTVAVIDAYQSAGFADIDLSAGPQDHLAVELKFISLLALREMGAWQAGDEDTAINRLGQQHDFLERHLAAWAPQWAKAVAEQAHEPLFHALAGLVEASLAQAMHELVELQTGQA